MAMMIKKCLACSQTGWHNGMKGEGRESAWRCCYCGFPVMTKVEDKRAFQLGVHRRQVAKVRLA